MAGAIDTMAFRVTALPVHHRDGANRELVFPLEAAKAPKKEVLLTYKYQPYVEKRHALFKSKLEVAPVYIKKPLRKFPDVLQKVRNVGPGILH